MFKTAAVVAALGGIMVAGSGQGSGLGPWLAGSKSGDVLTVARSAPFAAARCGPECTDPQPVEPPSGEQRLM